MFPRLHIGRSLVKWMAITTAYTLLVVFLVERLQFPKWSVGDEVTTIVGVVLGTLLVFRNKAAYDRWWEARILWGQLINETRNLALKSRAHVAVDMPELREFGRVLVAFAESLRKRLQRSSEAHSFPGYNAAVFPHGPGYFAGLVHQTLNRWNRQGSLKDTIWILDRHARALMDVSGGCERIQNTPLASSYRALTGYGIFLYVLAAPWAIALDFGLAELPAVLIGFAFLIGVELTAVAIEDPFGFDGDDLPLATYCQTISQFVESTLGEKPIEFADGKASFPEN